MARDSDKILLVMHDTKAAETLAHALSAHGAEVITCPEIEAAEALLPQLKAQILLTDLRFPPLFGVEGIKLIQHMRARFPDLIALGLAKENDDQLEALFAQAKGNKLFWSPYSPEAILSYVHGVQGKAAAPKKGTVQHLLSLDAFLKSGAITSLLQPIVGIKKDNEGQILGVESLARARSDQALWNPEMLFDYADRMEKTSETDALCIAAALNEAQNLAMHLLLFINVRPRSIVSHDFTEHLQKMVRAAGFDPTQIVIELTEQQTIANLDAFKSALQTLRAQGFGFALDDFGAGYANLEWLQSLKPDFLKLSGVFSRNLESDLSKQVIVKAATQMARRLAIPTILENVESASELEKAKALGIDYAQGYYFYQPKSAKSLREMIPGFHQAKTLA